MEHEGFPTACPLWAGKISESGSEPGPGIPAPRGPQKHPTSVHKGRSFLHFKPKSINLVEHLTKWAILYLLRKHTNLKLPIPQDYCCASADHPQERERCFFTTLALLISILHLPECHPPHHLGDAARYLPGQHRSPVHSSIGGHSALRWSSAISSKTRHWQEPSANKSKLFLKAKLKKEHCICKTTTASPFLGSFPQQAEEQEPRLCWEVPSYSPKVCGQEPLVVRVCSWEAQAGQGWCRSTSTWAEAASPLPQLSPGAFCAVSIIWNIPGQKTLLNFKTRNTLTDFETLTLFAKF